MGIGLAIIISLILLTNIGGTILSGIFHIFKGKKEDYESEESNQKIV